MTSYVGTKRVAPSTLTGLEGRFRLIDSTIYAVNVQELMNTLLKRSFFTFGQAYDHIQAIVERNVCSKFKKI